MSDNEFEFDELEEEEEDEEEEEEEEELEDDGSVVEPIEVDDEENIPINEYKTKFSNELRSEYIKTYHPEEIHKPFDEIYQLSHVTRNEGIIIDDNHKTYPILSKYEKTRIIGLRVSQLNKGAKPFITLKNKILDNSLIAEKELREKALPFIIMRPIPNAPSEYWKVSDLELI